MTLSIALVVDDQVDTLAGSLLPEGQIHSGTGAPCAPTIDRTGLADRRNASQTLHRLDAQAVNIRQYVAAQGWSFVELYTDAGLSAKKDNERPELQRLLHAAAAGKFDVIVVDKIDRFYRHLRGLLVVRDQLNAWSVSFASVQERLDFTTPCGKLTLTVLGMLAEIYIDNLWQETRKGKHQRARKGLWNGTVPYGYCKGLCSHCADPNGAGHAGDNHFSTGKTPCPTALYPRF